MAPNNFICDIELTGVVGCLTVDKKGIIFDDPENIVYVQLDKDTSVLRIKGKDRGNSNINVMTNVVTMGFGGAPVRITNKNCGVGNNYGTMGITTDKKGKYVAINSAPFGAAGTNAVCVNNFTSSGGITTTTSSSYSPGVTTSKSVKPKVDEVEVKKEPSIEISGAITEEESTPKVVTPKDETIAVKEEEEEEKDEYFWKVPKGQNLLVESISNHAASSDIILLSCSENLSIDSSGQCTVKIADMQQNFKTVRVSTSGMLTLDGQSVIVQELHCNNSGMCNINNFHVTKRAKISISGMSHVTFTHEPKAAISKHCSGMSSINTRKLEMRTASKK